MSNLKQIFSFLLLLSFTKIIIAQNTWSQKANLNGVARIYAIGFSIGSKGYIGTGITGSQFNIFLKDFWEWNQTTNSWTQKANFPGTPRWGAVGFSIGNYGYIGTGSDTTGELNDFWEWNQTNNTWSRKADLPGIGREKAIAFSIGTKGYIGTGLGRNISDLNDFWEWDQSINVWSQKANVGDSIFGATGFPIGLKGYIAANLNNNHFWEYDQATNVWLRKADFAGGERELATGFSIANKGYITTGYPNGYKDLWEWNQSSNSWVQKADLPTPLGRINAIGFSIGNRGYIGTGGDSVVGCRNDFWEYTPDSLNGIHEMNSENMTRIFPNPFESHTAILFDTELINAELNIYDLSGNLLKVINFSGNQTKLNCETMPTGTYIFTVFSKEKFISSGKLIKE